MSIDTSAAERCRGVICASTGAEVAGRRSRFIEIGPDTVRRRFADFPLAVAKARYQGEPVAAVVAESAALAEDAAEVVAVEYEALEPVIDAEQALTDLSILHEEAGTNRVWNGVWEYGDVEKAFKEAAYMVEIDKMHFIGSRHAAGEQRRHRPSGTRKTITSITGAIILFLLSPFSFWRRT